MKRTVSILLALIFLAGCASIGSLPIDNSGTGAGTSTGASLANTTSSTGSASTGTSLSSSGAFSSGAPLSGPYNAFPYLPDPKMSPGAVLDVTASDICVSGYSSKVRNVPQSEKDQVYQEYGITTHAPGSYEVDHLISLELGGSNSISNLWPESYTGDWNAHIKDKLENKLHALVCSGTLDLKTAQQAIAVNWIAAYKQYVGPQ